VATYVRQRLLQALLVIAGITLIVFFLARLAPGDPVDLMLPPDALPQERQNMRESLGLDKPIVVQYGIFLQHAARGDFGRSLYYRKPVLEIIAEYLPRTLILAGAALVVSLVIAIPLGVLAAVKRDTIFDYVGTVLALLGHALPGYWLGLMLILLFAVTLRWLPTSGYETPQHLILPAFTLGVSLAAIVMRLTRSGMLDVLNEDYIRTARAKGLSQWRVVMRHAIQNTLIPLVTVVGLQLGSLLSGAVIIETVFAWSGIGLVLVTAIGARDYPLIQAVVLFVSVIFVFTNLLVDLLYAALDPRISYQ
jgi:ABC-type dipeptide/oligopeptide/nickel transport system permease component